MPTPAEQRRRAQEEARRRQEESRARQDAPSSRRPTQQFAPDPFELEFLEADVAGEPLPIAPAPGTPYAVGPRTAAEQEAIQGYLSGQTGTPRRTGDFAYGDGGLGNVNWESILAAMEGQRPGGMSVDRSLFQLSETPEERAMLEAEIADIEARRAAGDVALRAGWGTVQASNSAAAQKARDMAAASGADAAAVWSNAAQQARDLAEERGRAAGQFEGRAAIDIDPQGGAADFVGFMESQAPAERRFAERQQEILGSDLDWMAGMAGSQGEAFAADLQRQANVLSFERAREHNLRVQDRTSQERMVLAQMQQQAQAANMQRDAFNPLQQINELVGGAAVMGSPEILAQQLGVTTREAQRMIDNFLSGTRQTILAANP